MLSREENEMDIWTKTLRALGVAEGGTLAHQLREDALDALGEAFLEQLHAETTDLIGRARVEQSLDDGLARSAVANPPSCVLDPSR